MSNSKHVYAVLLAGGGGTRLWPKSRSATPKQFLKLTGKQTMMQVAASRLTKLVNWDRIIVVTNEQYVDEVKQQLPQVPIENILAEPAKKDTALAMLIGTRYALNQDPEAVVVNSASDHVVQDEAEFVRVMKAAIEVASSSEKLVTVGITPTRPATGFGYIKIGQELTKIDRLPVFKVDSFTEKPNRATAQAFISTHSYFWNANMYVWSGKALLTAFEHHLPAMATITKGLADITAKEFHNQLAEIYNQADSISIDYAISEKSSNLVLLPGDFGWNDIGDWKVVYELGTKDLNGNVIQCESGQAPVLAVNAQNNLIHSDGRLVALVGVDDLIVVDTPQIVMVAPKAASQDVKKLVERLKEENQTEYL